MNEERYLSWWAKQNALRKDAYVTIGNLTLMVRSTVFSPDPNITHSTTIMLKHLLDLKGKSVLDVGTGTGILAIYAATNGAERVTAIDVDPAALANARENVKWLDLGSKITVIESDLFNNVEGKFDLILAQLPIVQRAWGHLEHSVFKLYQRFLKDVSSHLLPGGKILMSSASFGDVNRLLKLLEQSGMKFETHKETKFDVEWYLFEITQADNS